MNDTSDQGKAGDHNKKDSPVAAIGILAKLLNKRLFGALEMVFGGFVLVFFVFVTYEDLRLRGMSGAIAFWLGSAFFGLIMMIDGMLNYLRSRKGAPAKA